MRLPFLVVIGTLLLCGLVAAEFDVGITVINNSVFPFETASYRLVLTNGLEQNDVINVRSTSNDWIITPQSFIVPTNQNVSSTLFITPKSTVGLSTHDIPLIFSSTRSEYTVQENILLRLSLDLLTRGYPINVRTNVTLPSSVDPRGPLSVNVFMKNNNLRNIDTVTIYIRSNFFEQTFETPLEPLSVFRKEFTYVLDPYTEPGIYDVYIQITSADKTISNEQRTFTVDGYATIDSSREVVYSSWLKTVEKITITNDGNQDHVTTTKFATNFWQRLFTTTTPKTKVIDEEGVDKYVWSFALDARKSADIYVTTTYRYLAAGILVVILIIISYFLFRSPIIMFKETMMVSKDEEGDNELKVRVYIRNRSGRQVQNLKVIDRVPNIAELVKHTHLGTLQPTKITRSEKKGTIVRWEIAVLEPYEERIISYKIKSKLKIVGAMSLPEARVKFDTRGGRERVAGSGRSQAAR